MSWFLSNRRRVRADVDDADDVGEQLTEGGGPGDGPAMAGKRRWSGDRRAKQLSGPRGGVGGFVTATSTRAFLVLMVGAIVAGPAALLIELSRPEVAPAVTAVAPAAAEVGSAARAGSTATHLVRVWLSAGNKDREQVAALVMMPPQTLQLPAVRPQPPTWVQVADVDQTTVGEWRVLVQAGGGLAGRAATYLVLVQVDDTTATALTMPARIPAPPAPTTRPADLRTVRLSDPAAAAVSGFTTALLTGDADLSRWVSPDSTLQPGPKACQTVTITQVLSNTADPTPAAGSELTVLASVDCTITKATESRQPVAQPLQYPLLLRARDGRWEVVRYADATPHNSHNAAAATPAGTVTPSPSSSRTER